jgi:hypothetical protein
MSRIGTPQSTQPASVPHDKIAMRAYEKWVNKGRPCGSEKQDWFEAEAELRAELARTGGTTGTTVFGRR